MEYVKMSPDRVLHQKSTKFQVDGDEYFIHNFAYRYSDVLSIFLPERTPLCPFEAAYLRTG